MGTHLRKSRNKFSSRLYFDKYTTDLKFKQLYYRLKKILKLHYVTQQRSYFEHSSEFSLPPLPVVGAEMPSGIAACAKSTQVTIQCRLNKTGGASPHRGIWDRTWRLMTFHKSTSTDKNADWERPIYFLFFDCTTNFAAIYWTIK